MWLGIGCRACSIVILGLHSDRLQNSNCGTLPFFSVTAKERMCKWDGMMHRLLIQNTGDEIICSVRICYNIYFNFQTLQATSITIISKMLQLCKTSFDQWLSTFFFSRRSAWSLASVFVSVFFHTIFVIFDHFLKSIVFHCVLQLLCYGKYFYFFFYFIAINKGKYIQTLF